MSRKSLRARLWVGGVAVALFVASLLAAGAVLSPSPSPVLDRVGHDFLPFYAAGSLVREGRPLDVYDVDALRTREREIGTRDRLPLGDGFGPFWNPPFYAVPFAPLSALPFWAAMLTWTGINLFALAVAMTLLWRVLVRQTLECRATPCSCDACVALDERRGRPGTDTAAAKGDAGVATTGGKCPGVAGWRSAGLIPLLVVASAPFLLALTHGQNTFCSLLLLTLAVLAWRARRAVLTGLVIGLLAYKPQLAALVGLIALIDLGWRVAAGALLSGGALLLTAGWAMPGIFETYRVALPRLLHFMQAEHVYMWERHVTLKAFWRLLVQGYATGETSPAVNVLTVASAGVIVVGLLAAAVRCRRSPAGRDRLIAATIAGMPLVMPFYFDYDLLLLAIPAVLYAVERSAAIAPPGRGLGDRCLLPAWCALYVWLIINPDVAERTHVNVAVPLLGAVAACLLARALRPATETAQCDPDAVATPAFAVAA